MLSRHNITLQLHIQIKQVHTPEVWRRVLVPAQFTFHRFHKIIQAAFGWENLHIFQFIEFERCFVMPLNIGMPDARFDEPYSISSAKKVRIGQVIPFEEKLKYIYDFCDLWEHVITHEQTYDEHTRHASLIDGAGACPPEACGGASGYETVKRIMLDPQHEQHHSQRSWLGLKENETWEPDAFNLKKMAGRVAKV